MEAVIPWVPLLAVIEPYYPKGKRGRPPIGLERMLRVYFLQQWYGLADEALEDALYDSQALQSFARIDLSAEGVPDATTLLNFRRLLETHDLCKGLFTAINADLTARTANCQSKGFHRSLIPRPQDRSVNGGDALGCHLDRGRREIRGLPCERGTPGQREVSEIADTRVPRGANFHGFLNGRRRSVRSAD